MNTETMRTRSGALWIPVLATFLCLSVAACSTTTRVHTPQRSAASERTPEATTEPAAHSAASSDPRVGLEAGWHDAGQAAWNLELIGHHSRPDGFFNPERPGDFAFANSDLAFQGHYVFQGNYNGFQIWDLSDPSHPTLRAKFECPGGQGDVSVYGDLLFMSVQERRARLDCGTQGVADTVSAERFRGVRVFDISDLDHPEQIAAVQTCRGSHTHTLVTDPNDPENIYIYVSGTSRVRPAAELAGCSAQPPDQDPNTSYFRIVVIRVPLAAPENAEIVSKPRIFARNGKIAGLWMGGSHGPGTQKTLSTNQFHDITAYPAIGLAAGACSGNGLLLDISDPAHPERIDYVSDPNFAYWHSATFNNAGTTVLFTDEWGGGVAPHCRESDPMKWGADAIFTLSERELSEAPAGYYKMPAPQTEFENCVAHNGSLIPVPGRDIMVQAWYQGGVSVFDFSDPAHPVEIAFFDRGPMDADEAILGGYWSVYWYNGHIIGSEIGRGIDIFELKPSKYLSQNEIEAARLVHFDQFNAQNQPKVVWPARFVVARAYLDQLMRNRDESGIDRGELDRIVDALDRAEQLEGEQRRAALTELAMRVAQYENEVLEPERVEALASVLNELAQP